MIKKFIKIFRRKDTKKGLESKLHSLDEKNIKLSDIKYIIENTNYINNEDEYRKYCNMAIKLYRNNSLGYISLAKLEMNQCNYIEAKNLLEKSPKTKVGAELLMLIESENTKPASPKKPIDNENKMPIFKNLNEEKEFIMKKLIVDPFNLEFQNMLLKFYQKVNDNNSIEKLLGLFSNTISSNATLSLIFKKSSFYQQCGDYISSYNILISAQKKYTGDRRVLFKIAEVLKFDREVDKAYIMLLAGEIDNPMYGAIRRLSFEVDHSLIGNAHETLSKILEYSMLDLTRYMTMINRVSAYFPEYTDKLIDTRIEVEKELNIKLYRGEKHFNTRYQYLLQGRYLDEIENKLKFAKQKGLVVWEDTEIWLDKIKHFIYMDDKGSFEGFVKLANKNEQSDVLFGFDKGIPILIDRNLVKTKRTVEVFIPNSIFTNPKTDKASFIEINLFFKEIFLFLLQRDDIIIIPRHQYNWRYCKPHTDGKIISYHTHSKQDYREWLHIQESTLHGYCSVDSEGFAGYSSLAHDFHQIEEKVKNIDDGVLEAHHKYLKNIYIDNNVSKYKQEDVKFRHNGNYVFVALQVMTDIVSDLAYIRGIELVDTIANAYKDTGVKVIVKRHPYCNAMSLQKKLEELESNNLIMQTNASIHSIIKNCKVVFTVNSGVGLEALIHLKPVIVSGDCDYMYAVNSLVKNKSDLLQIIKEDNFEIDKVKILKFLYFYTKFYTQDKNSIRKVLTEWLK